MNDKYQWDLTYFYKNNEEIEKDFEEVKVLADKMASYEGKLKEENNLVEYLRLDQKMNAVLDKLFAFSHLQADKNRKDVDKVALEKKVRITFSELVSKLAFEEPELIALGEQALKDFIINHPEFDEYSHHFEKLFVNSDHVYSSDKEKLLSAYNQLSGEGASLYSCLSVGDGQSKKVTLSNGEEVEVSQATWTHLIPEAPTAEDRQKIFEALYSHYEEHKNTFAEIYNTVLQAELAVTKARGYSSILQSHLEGNKIPEGVFLTLIDVASNNAAPLHKYIKLRSKALGLKKHRSYDRFLQLASSKKKYTYEEAKELFYKSIEKFPKDYQEKAREVTKYGFVDVYPNDGKRAGAYSSSFPDSHPFILLNFVGDLEDVFTLAHESGHSIHSLYAAQAQKGIKQNYTIFVAEIASTFNEHNLIDYLLGEEGLDKEDKIYLLQKAIDEIVATFYRQTLFAHFEYEVSKLVEQGQPLNYEVLSKIMIDLYKQYYGIDIEEEKLKQYVWAYIPHLYNSPFYVYQYATSFTSSMLLYQKVKEGVPGAFENHISLLKAGGSDFPVEEVKAAGVDLTKKETYLSVINRMEELVNKLEELLG